MLESLERWLIDHNFEIIERNVKERTARVLEALFIPSSSPDLCWQKEGVYHSFPGDVLHRHGKFVIHRFSLL